MVDTRTDSWNEKTTKGKIGHRVCENEQETPVEIEAPLAVRDMILMWQMIRDNRITAEQFERWLPAVIDTLEGKIGRSGKKATDRQAAYAANLLVRADAASKEMEPIVRSAFVNSSKGRFADKKRRRQSRSRWNKGSAGH
jgi:hypothetical protein